MILVLSFMVKLGLAFAQYRSQRLKSALEPCAWDENLLDLWLFARSDFDAPARSQSRCRCFRRGGASDFNYWRR